MTQRDYRIRIIDPGLPATWPELVAGGARPRLSREPRK